MGTVAERVDIEGALTWVLGDASMAAVIDPGGDGSQIRAALGERELRAIVCTHAHHEHVSSAVVLAESTGAPILIHPDEMTLWHKQFPHRRPDVEVVQGMTLNMGDVRLRALKTPGHTEGSLSWHCPELGVVFTGGTLGANGPVADCGGWVDYDQMVASIRLELFVLATQTVVHPGHGASTRIATERSRVEYWGYRS